jgi:HEPN domain-containing protein
MEKEERWLLIGADFHYLSARLNFMHGFFLVALHISATSIEMYLKCLEKCKNGKFEKGHNLVNRINKVNINIDENYKEFLQQLENSYKNKYPDEWKGKVRWPNVLEPLDFFVMKIRNLAIVELKKIDPENKNDVLKACINSKDLLPGNTAMYGALTSIEVFHRSNRFISQFQYLV